MIVISDLHIGREDCQINEVAKFLKDNPTEELILNGDIFDQFAMFKSLETWRKHRPIVKETWRMLKGRKTKIVYLVGNHDYLAFFLAPFGFLFGMKIRKRVIRDGYLIEHGDWISLYLRVRGIKRRTFHDNCEVLARIKEKILIVGHSHHSMRSWKVIDVGDWVGSGTYFNSDVAQLVRALD